MNVDPYFVSLTLYCVFVGYCQMMVSHDAVGGFHADIDQVDAPSELALGVDKDLLKQTFAGMSNLQTIVWTCVQIQLQVASVNNSILTVSCWL